MALSFQVLFYNHSKHISYKVTFSADADPKAVVKDPKTAKGEDYFFGGKHTINL